MRRRRAAAGRTATRELGLGSQTGIHDLPADAESNLKRCGAPALLLAREDRFAEAETLVRAGIEVAVASDLLGWQADLLMGPLRRCWSSLDSQALATHHRA